VDLYGAQINGYELGNSLKKKDRDWKKHYNM
jgi:hypothetical protein